ncbi:hypothetical protein SBA5_440040 [Candidatus Sulfotelmatomonas gaucii]|uniref:Uncharacterized protein n=1 Tax=Candidatus Sulfuritelmatomonas gaucii TaxID=2043161 RepID=A0A2N9LMD4_9BACT|nr:hypothetical protein SBA5_440040 [Candidatus Sulfotelmatomonas gaucii]
MRKKRARNLSRFFCTWIWQRNDNHAVGEPHFSASPGTLVGTAIQISQPVNDFRGIIITRGQLTN